MTTAEIFKSEKIFLKKLEPADIDDRFLSWFEDRDLIKYYSGTKRSFTKDSILADLKSGEESGQHHTFGIFTNDKGLCIGTVKIGPILKEHSISDLVTLIGDRSYHGKGLATEAIRLAIKIAFEKFHIRKLVTGMYEENVSSIRSYVKAGFVIEGQLKGHYLVEGKPMDRVLVGCINKNWTR